MLTETSYNAPVADLLTLGNPNTIELDVVALDLEQAHVPELVRMAGDLTLYNGPEDSPQMWAPYHAMQALKGLDASDFAKDLVALFDLDDEWFREELPELFGRIGQPSLAPLQTYLADPTHDEWALVAVTNALSEVVKQHPKLRDEVVAILSDLMGAAEQYEESTCSYALDVLLELKAIETLPLIRHAFEVAKIDPMVCGPWKAVVEELGGTVDPDDPLIAISQQRHDEQYESLLSSLPNEPVTPAPKAPKPSKPQQRPAQSQSSKNKQKRKTSSAARKANRKKRK